MPQNRVSVGVPTIDSNGDEVAVTAWGREKEGGREGRGGASRDVYRGVQRGFGGKAMLRVRHAWVLEINKRKECAGDDTQ